MRWEEGDRTYVLSVCMCVAVPLVQGCRVEACVDGLGDSGARAQVCGFRFRVYGAECRV